MTADNIFMFWIGYFPLGASVIILTIYLLKSRRERRAEKIARAAAELEKENRARAAEEKRKAAEMEADKKHAEKLRRAAELAELAERRLNAEREYIRLVKNAEPANVTADEPVHTPESVTEQIQIIPFNELIKECSQQPLSDQGSAKKLPEIPHREPAERVSAANRRAYTGSKGMFGFNCPVLDAKRVARACEEVEIISLYSDHGDYHAICKGSNGEKYNTTLSNCKCKYFRYHRQPCKHMIRLAMIAGLLNDKGETPEQETTRIKTDAQIKAALSCGFSDLYGIEIVPADVLSEIYFFSGSSAALSKEAAAVLDIPLNDFINKAKQLI